MLYNNQPKGFLVGRVVIVVMSVDMIFFMDHTKNTWNYNIWDQLYIAFHINSELVNWSVHMEGYRILVDHHDQDHGHGGKLSD